MKTYLTNNEVKAMIDSATNLRDKMIISFYANTGCRASELLKVKVKDIDLGRNLVMIPHLKHGIDKHCPSCGRKAGASTKFCSKCGNDLRAVQATGSAQHNRLIDIDDSTRDLMKEYIQNMSLDDNLIVLTRQMIYHIIRGAAESVGIKGRVILNPETGKMHYPHPHNLRDSLAVSWLKFHGDSEGQKALQNYLGHRRYETTSRYHKLDPANVTSISQDVRKARNVNS